MTTVTDRHTAYEALVRERKACLRCSRLTNPATFQGGEFDSDRLGPYSRWQGNLDAELVVVGQDFAGTESFAALQGWPGARVGTNLALIELVASAGIRLEPPSVGQPHDRIFLTNAIQCLKPGSMQGRPPASYARECVPRYLRPLLEIVRPRAVVTLGDYALTSILAAYGTVNRESLEQLIALERTFTLPLRDGGSTILFPRMHPSRTVQNARRSLELQKRDWEKIGAFLAHAAPRGTSSPDEAPSSAMTLPAGSATLTGAASTRGSRLPS
jgi:DNA polymerase